MLWIRSNSLLHHVCPSFPSFVTSPFPPFLGIWRWLSHILSTLLLWLDGFHHQRVYTGSILLAAWMGIRGLRMLVVSFIAVMQLYLVFIWSSVDNARPVQRNDSSRTGLRDAKHLNIFNLMVEGDSLHVIRWASCRCKPPWRLADVEEIFDLSSLIHASFSHSMREAILWRSPWQRRKQGGRAYSLSLLIKSSLVTDKKKFF